MRYVRIPALGLAAVAMILSASTALAVKPQTWGFATQKDFAEGRFNNTIVDSYGQLTLGRSLTPIKLDSPAELVTGFAQTQDGATYVSTSPDAKVLRIDGEKTTVIYKAPKGFTDITALAADGKGNLLVALSGDSARLERVVINGVGGKPTSSIRLEDKDVDYIWAIQQGADGTLYLGTGPHGKIYKLVEKGEPEVLLDTKSKNVTALTTDKAGNLIAGTDSPGLVIRIDGKTNKPFVLLDAGKVDVNGIVMGKEGDIFVATAKAEPGDNGAPDNSEEPGTGSKSKPTTTEPDAVEPPDGDVAPEKKASPHAGAMLQLHEALPFQDKAIAEKAIPFIPTIVLGAPKPELPPAVQALLKKAAEAAKKEGPSTKRGPSLPEKGDRAVHAPMGGSGDDESAPEDASAVYRISPAGIVTTLVQQDDLNYSLLLSGDDLLIGTGDEGKLYSYHLPDESVTLLARVKEEHITTLFADATGSVLVGTANMGAVYRLGNDLATSGTFVSQVMDASHSANWGHAMVEVDVPEGTKATFATRTGNTKGEEEGEKGEEGAEKGPKFWSDWSEEGEAAKNEKISSPVARYFQVRVTLSGEGKVSPVLHKLTVTYQTENLPPEVKNLAVELPGAASDDNSPDADNNGDGPSNSEKLTHITWDGSDPNGDTLSYKIYYKLASDKDIWTPVAKDLADAVYEWDTKSLADGKYVVKVVASDAPDNDSQTALSTARMSATFTIDNTPPVLGGLASKVVGNVVTITGDATDGLSAISDVRYQIDGQGDWQPAAASDKIFDSPHEGFTIVTRALAAGGHRITVRATDSKGNSSYKAATVSVKP